MHPETLPYPIGTPGQPWGDSERAHWLARQTVKRSYMDEVLIPLKALPASFELHCYGSLSQDPDRYTLHAARSRNWSSGKPSALVTGGVHGYETSGVQGALRFLLEHAEEFTNRVNLLVAPCVSPWGYETINRWNAAALDPNRSFAAGSGCEESLALMKFLDPVREQFDLHIDLHETTDTDNSEFRPALQARDAKPQDVWDIPDGFYTVGDSARPAPEFQAAIIASVRQVTHIAEADDSGRIIGEALQQPGVINYDARPLGLCMGFTEARFVTTTEMYPDSPRTNPEICIEAQVASVRGGLGYLLDS